jgi:hypothetical protein
MAEIKSQGAPSQYEGKFDWKVRTIDYARHVADLRTRSYEGAVSRDDREKMFCRAFDVVTPVAHRVLSDLNDSFLASSGRMKTVPPARTEEGGLIGSWELTWPSLEQAKNRFDGSSLEPLAIHAIFPLAPTGAMQWTHPHFALLRSGCREGLGAAWPMQITSPEDAWRQEPILRVLAEAELHERTFLANSNWRLLSSFCDPEYT